MSRTSAIAAATLVAASVVAYRMNAAELTILAADNYDAAAPGGKEADSIYGDFLLRNDAMSAVIAKPGRRRNANLTVHGVGGSLIDLTSREQSNDQLSALFPLSGWTLTLDRVTVDGQAVDEAALAAGVSGEQIALVFNGTPPKPADASAPAVQATARLTYLLSDGEQALTVRTSIHNIGDTPLTDRALQGDDLRLDGEFEFGVDSDLRMAWGADRFWRQAYGVLPAKAKPRVSARSIERRRPFVRYATRDNSELAPGETRTRERRVIAATDLLALKALATELREQAAFPATIRVLDDSGPVGDATITIRAAGADEAYAFARTDDSGAIQCELPPGAYDVTVGHHARGEASGRLDVGDLVAAESEIELPAAGYVVGEITDGDGQPIACKVDFARVDGGAAPNFGPDSAIYGVRNLVYTADGKFRVTVRPGEYDLLASHGPEHDVANTRINAVAGQETKVTLQLPRTVDTTGWISAEYHSHSSPSGDNTSSQRGRVLNLLAEHLEFAPCTEHQRITTYDAHLEALGATERLASCPGMELTGQPLPLNHQNAFPLIHHDHAQDGGGPETDVDPVTQIRRLAMWDDGSDKLVQTNHPNIPQMLGDRDLNGQADRGFAEMFGLMDVIEVHPPQEIFSTPESLPQQARERGNTIFHWMQLLNQGRRVPGVVNTDAHWNFHGSGWLRNYIKSSTDNPAEIDVMEMVHESEHGHIVMSNGPFMEVTATSADATEPALPGDDLAAPDGKATLDIRVQCPNWLDVNRVQVFVNGRPDSQLNFTRGQHREKFPTGVVKFAATVEVELPADAHLIVAAIGEGLTLGRVYGPDQGKSPPVAVANPIFVDVDGGGFQPSGDMLGVPLPVLEPVEPHSHEAAHHHHLHDVYADQD